MEDTIKYYATEYMNGEKRYDYAMKNFVSDKGMTASCSAKNLGFVRYNIKKSIPTPQFSGDEELSLDTIRDNDTIDNNVYVVVHTASDYVSMDQLQSDFITSHFVYTREYHGMCLRSQHRLNSGSSVCF